MTLAGTPGGIEIRASAAARREAIVTDGKLAALLEVGRLQMEVAGSFFQAEESKALGDYSAAGPRYEEYVAKSRAFLEATLEFNERFPDSPYELLPVRPLVNALMVQADIVQALGDREKAEALRDEAVKYSREHLGKAGTADAERARAGALVLEGRFNEAIVALMNARDVSAGQRDPQALTRVVIDLADVLQWLGDYRRAKEEIEHAERIMAPAVALERPTQGGVLVGLVSSLSSIMAGSGDPGDAERAVELYRAATEVTYYHGLISKALGEWDEAERCFTEVLPAYRSLRAGEAIEFQLAQIKLGRGQAGEALEQVRRIAPAFDGGAFRPKRGVLQRLQAECHHTLGDSGAALQAVDQSVADLSERHFDPDALWRSQWLRARICAGLENAEAALESFRDAIATITSLRRAPLGYRLDSTYLADKTKLYSDAIDAAREGGAALACCEFMDSIKSRTLSAVLSVAEPETGDDSKLEVELSAVTQRLDTMEYQAYREGWNRERRRVHHDLLEDRGHLLERIRISDPRWRALSEPAPIDFGALFEVLAGRSQAVLALHYEPPSLTAVLLFDGKASCERLTISEGTAKKLSSYAGNLQKASYNPYEHDLSVEFSVLADDLIPAPLLSAAQAADSLVVVPHGRLHLLPWSALVHDGRRLFERLPVGVVPNLGVLSTARNASTPKQIALVGVSSYPDMERVDHLPSALDEIGAVSSVYEQAGIRVLEPLLDDAATESAFWELGRSAGDEGGVLHMSCHGTIVPSEPMSSGLLLSDSKVDAAEIARARLPFDEVVLSACSTGWRPTRVVDVELSADEILGIPAGFLESGAVSVLVSIPKAEGRAARTLTTRYHERRAAGDSPLRALQSAQQHLLSEGVAPGTWVGFTLYGCV
jgi:CHAT domain-containing protein